MMTRIEHQTASEFVERLGRKALKHPEWKVSGGRVLTSKTKPSANRAAAALRLAAGSLYHSQSALGAYYRRMQAKFGAPKAITATAHKLARIVYSMLKHGSEYVDAGQDYYERQYKERVVRSLQQRAKALGFELMPTAQEVVPTALEGAVT